MIPTTSEKDCKKYNTHVYYCECKDFKHGRYETRGPGFHTRGSYIDPLRGDAVCKHIYAMRHLRWYMMWNGRYRMTPEAIAANRAMILDHKAEPHLAVLAPVALGART